MSLSRAILSTANASLCILTACVECTELRASESFPKECPFFFGRVASLAGHRITDPIKFWGEVLREYSSGQLTQSGDKPLALSGVAKWMESQTHDTYLAGLWKNDIDWQLTWLISPSTRRGRPLQYRAPSWSWSAVDGHVNLSSFVDRFLIELTLNVSVLNISITYKAVDVFGQVENGNLRMECKKMKRACQDTNRSIFESYISPLCLDTLDDDVNESCFYLPVYMTPKYVYSTLSSGLVDKISMQGLVLQKTGHKQGEYRRIGGFEGREVAIGAYEAVSEDDAETTDYKIFVDENSKRYFPYTITII
jgi:hypothetical protein